MKKSEIYNNAIYAMINGNEDLDWDDEFQVLRQLFQDYETALSIEEWEAKNKESNPATYPDPTVMLMEADE
jgi:hypothetical protein